MQKGPAEWYKMQESAVPRLVHGLGVIFLFRSSSIGRSSFYMSGEEPSAAYTFTKIGHTL